jgi:hypothetical protein
MFFVEAKELRTTLQVTPHPEALETKSMGKNLP